MGPNDRQASSRSLPLHSVLVNPENKKKNSTQSESGVGSGSRRVSFIDEITGNSASRTNPELERQLSFQLEEIKEAGEMGEFLNNNNNENENRTSTTPDVSENRK